MRSSMSSSDMWQPAQPPSSRSPQSLWCQPFVSHFFSHQAISFCNFARVASSAGMPSGALMNGTTGSSRPSRLVTWPRFSVHTWAGSTTSADLQPLALVGGHGQPRSRPWAALAPSSFSSPAKTKSASPSHGAGAQPSLGGADGIGALHQGQEAGLGGQRSQGGVDAVLQTGRDRAPPAARRFSTACLDLGRAPQRHGVSVAQRGQAGLLVVDHDELGAAVGGALGRCSPGPSGPPADRRPPPRCSPTWQRHPGMPRWPAGRPVQRGHLRRRAGRPRRRCAPRGSSLPKAASSSLVSRARPGRPALGALEAVGCRRQGLVPGGLHQLARPCGPAGQ